MPDDQEQFEGISQDHEAVAEPEAAPPKPVKKPTVAKPPRKVTQMKRTIEKREKKISKTVVKPKKTVKETIKQGGSRRRKTPVWVWVLLVVGLALVIAGIVLLLRRPAAPAAQGTIAAVINGQQISMDQLDRQFALLPESYRAFYTKATVLSQLIDEEIVIQFGEKNGVTVTPEDVTNEIQNTLGDWGVNAKDLETNLAQFNLTTDDFEKLMERKLKIERSMALIFVGVTPPTEDALRLYYTENNDSYFTAEQVKARHILIASQRDNAAVLGKELKERVEAGEDFCGLVSNYTDDKGSKDTCGEYTFPRGMMVPEFENAAFSLKPGQVTLIQTQFGYHVIQKLEDVPAGLTPFEDVKEQINTTLARATQVATYQSWLDAEKTASTIEVLYTEPAAPAK